MTLSAGTRLGHRTEQQIWVSSYSTLGDVFVAGKPRLWSEARFTQLGGAYNFDVAPDGKRFAVLKAPDEDSKFGRDKIVFILNFFDELRRVAK